MRIHEGAIDVVAPRRGPLAWFFARAGVSAFTWGQTIVYRHRGLLEDERLLRHERAHVRQSLLLGPLLAVAYPASSLLQLFRGGHAYRDNWFERDARRREHPPLTCRPGRPLSAAMPIVEPSMSLPVNMWTTSRATEPRLAFQ